MPSSLKRFARPKIMKIKYGRGTLKAKVIGTYTRYIDGKRHTSHHIRRLDVQRKAKLKINGKMHKLHEHFVDSKKTWL